MRGELLVRGRARSSSAGRPRAPHGGRSCLSPWGWPARRGAPARPAGPLGTRWLLLSEREAARRAVCCRRAWCQKEEGLRRPAGSSSAGPESARWEIGLVPG